VIKKGWSNIFVIVTSMSLVIGSPQVTFRPFLWSRSIAWSYVILGNGILICFMLLMGLSNSANSLGQFFERDSSMYVSSCS
jgi:hypothetical protein